MAAVCLVMFTFAPGDLCGPLPGDAPGLPVLTPRMNRLPPFPVAVLASTGLLVLSASLTAARFCSCQ